MRTLEDLIPKLTEKTKDGAISWEKGIGTDGYKTIVGKFHVYVWKWMDEIDETEGVSIGLKLSENENEFIDTIVYDAYASKFDFLMQLYRMARRSFMKLDRLINDLEKELDKKVP